jgi:hypothetical protein
VLKRLLQTERQNAENTMHKPAQGNKEMINMQKMYGHAQGGVRMGTIWTQGLSTLTLGIFSFFIK